MTKTIYVVSVQHFVYRRCPCKTS